MNQAGPTRCEVERDQERTGPRRWRRNGDVDDVDVGYLTWTWYESLRAGAGMGTWRDA